MHRFDYEFLKEMVPANIVSISNIIYDLNARDILRRKDNETVFRGLRDAAIIESVRGSNAIEGIVTTKTRMREIVKENASPQTHAEQEIFGYKKVLEEIYNDEFDADISEELIQHFHYVMLQSVSKEAGQYKKENNYIQERSKSGKFTVRVVPVKAKDTPEAMRQFIMAYREAAQSFEISRLFLIACVIVDFLCIHPFVDGNGRISRILTTLLLQRSGFDIGRYISIEGKINEYKSAYYDSLKAASVGWHENENDYTPFIIFLLQIIYECFKDLDRKFISNSSEKIPKSKQIENMLLNSFVPVSKEELIRRLPDISVTTIERVVGKMVKEGRIQKIGTYRNARYKRK